jgi:hypothetical protein
MASPPTANGVPANAQARVNGLVAADAAKARVYTFDPDASPQEKAAQAAKGRDQLKRVGGQNGGLQPAGGFRLSSSPSAVRQATNTSLAQK